MIRVEYVLFFFFWKRETTQAINLIWSIDFSLVVFFSLKMVIYFSVGIDDHQYEESFNIQMYRLIFYKRACLLKVCFYSLWLRAPHILWVKYIKLQKEVRLALLGTTTRFKITQKVKRTSFCSNKWLLVDFSRGFELFVRKHVILNFYLFLR